MFSRTLFYTDLYQMTLAFFGSSGHFSIRAGTKFAPAASSVHAVASGHPSTPTGNSGAGGGGGVFIAATPHRDKHPLLSAGVAGGC